MENALLVGLSRQMALSHELDIVANNIANIDTTGYKADNALFAQYLMPKASDDQFTGSDRRISFVQDRASWIDFSPGALQRTGNPLDVAIEGNAYLAVQTPRGVRYSRNGALLTNASGQLVTSDGYPVLGDSGPITFQSTDHDVIISATGIITVREGASTTDSPRGKLQLVAFDQQDRLQKDGGSTFLGASRRQSHRAGLRHARGARRDREIQRQRRRRDFAHDPDHAVLHRHRQRFAAAERPAQKRADAAVAGADFGQFLIASAAGQGETPG